MAEGNGTQPEFDFEAVFEVDDYMYFYTEMLTPESTLAQVNFVLRELTLKPPARILDLACGFGRHANRLAGLGYQVTGIDLTPGFLEIARRDADALGVTVDYRSGDMRRLAYTGAFDAVLLLFTAFGYFEDAENQLVMNNIARALRPGGRVVLDIQNRDVFLVGYRQDHVTEKNGDLMIDRHRYDMLRGRLYNQRIVIRDGIRKEKPFFIRLYNASEITQVLQQAGLEVEKIVGGWDSSPLSIDSRRMIIIGRKA